MSAPIAESEISPGLVVHLDTEALRAHGGCTTNVDTTATTSPVNGPHYFLVLSYDPTLLEALAVPLFSDHTPGAVRLDDAEKAGPARDWIGPQEASYYSRYQHWRIPSAAMIAASVDDDGVFGTRRRYADNKPALIEEAIAFQAGNRKKTFDSI